MCALLLTHPRAHTPGSGLTGLTGGQLGVQCLAQGSHLSRGHFLPEPRTHNLRLQVQRYPLGTTAPRL